MVKDFIFRKWQSDRLRDQLVLELKSTSIQRKLLAENDLTLDHALAIANSMELAAKDCEELSRISDGSKGSTLQMSIFSIANLKSLEINSVSDVEA